MWLSKSIYVHDEERNCIENRKENYKSHKNLFLTTLNGENFSQTWLSFKKPIQGVYIDS